MNETHFNYLWDISFEETDNLDTIFIDTGHDVQIYLTKSDLTDMLDALEDICQ